MQFTQALGRKHGQTIAETALLLPVIVFLLFGMLELGRVFNAWIEVTQAAREGARVGAATCSVNAGCATTVGTAITNSLPGLVPARTHNTITQTPTAAPPYKAGSSLRVQVQYDVPLLIPLVSALLGNQFTVTGTTTMRIE
jgi:Flp pilus assembly protein TadG